MQTIQLWFGLCLCVTTMTANALDSKRLSDVIKSNGIGQINLLKDLAPSSLEALRQLHNGKLVFAVDVNEAANGSEKASSQAISLKSVSLQLLINQSVIHYDNFSTRTKALLYQQGSSSRQEYFTLLGEAGSSRLSASNSIQGVFDATLEIPVDIELSEVTSAILHVELLETDLALGDPEAFYDYSNGFEDIAIVNLQDARFIDSYQAGVAEAPLVINQELSTASVNGWLHYPSSATFYIVAYEDLFPLLGDYDFNDLTVAYQVSYGLNADGQVIMITGNAYLLTRGAVYDHDWYLNIGLPDGVSGWGTVSTIASYGQTSQVNRFDFNGSLLIKGFEHTRLNLVDPEYDMANTFPWAEFIQGPKASFRVQLDQPVEINSISMAPFDPFIYVHDSGYEIHLLDQLPTQGSKNWDDNLIHFRDDNGFPFAMLLPSDWKPPYAGINIQSAYPKFADFVISQGESHNDWFLAPMESNVFDISVEEWRW